MIPFGATITKWYIVADQSGSLAVDLQRGGTSIIGGSGNYPTLTSQQSNSASVTSWTSTSISDGDAIQFIVNSASTITKATIVIKINKT